METKKHPQLLVLLTLLNVLFSQALALPLSKAEALRNVRHADRVSTNDSINVLGQHSVKTYPESMIETQDSLDVSGHQGPIQRSVDTIYNNEYSRIRKQMKLRKEIAKILKSPNETRNKSEK